MADERLNDQPIAKDGAYVYAEDASGNQIKISKADLATVVAGVVKNGKIKTVNITPNTKTNTGVSTVGLYKLQIGSINYTTPLYLIVTGTAITMLNETWYSGLMTFEYNDGALFLTYATNNNALLYITLLE